jgi:hypothetical protein
MAYSNAEIVKFLIDNPQLTDAQLADVIKATGVSVSQIAEATVSKVDDIQKRLEEKADKVYVPPPVAEPATTYEEPAAPVAPTLAEAVAATVSAPVYEELAAPVAPPLVAPVAGLLDLPTVAPVELPAVAPVAAPVAPVVKAVAAPIAPPAAPVAEAKISKEQIVDFLIKTPNLTDAELAKAMDTYKLSPSDIAKATVSKVEDIEKRYEKKADTVYKPVVEPTAAPVTTSLLDSPTVAPIAPVKEAAPTAPVAKTGTQQMVDLLIKNPNLTDAELVKAMETYKVSPADIAKATVSDEGKIAARVAATLPPNQAILLGDTYVQAVNTVTGSGEDQQVGGIERVVTYKAGENKVGGDVKQFSPEGKYEQTTKQQEVNAAKDFGKFLLTAGTLFGLPAGIGEAVGLGTGATANAVGTGLLSSGSAAIGGADLKDIVKAGVLGGGASLLGSTLGDLVKPTIDASGLPADIGITERQLAIADAKQLADQGLSVSQIKDTLTANGYNDAIVGRAITAITPAATAPVTTAPVAPSVAADNVLVTAPNAVVPSTVPNLSSVISTLAASPIGTTPIETVNVETKRDVVAPTVPSLSNVIAAIGTPPIGKPPIETVNVEDKKIKEEDKKVTIPTIPTVPTTPIDTLTVTAPRPVVTAIPTAPIVPTIPLVLPTIPATPPAPPPTPPKPPEPPPEDKKPPSVTDIIKIIAPLVLAPAIVKSLTPDKPSFPIVPIPTEWTPPPVQPTTPFQPLTPIDFGNQNLLKGTQWEKFLDPNYGKVPAPRQYAQPSNLSYNDLMGILGSKQGMPPTSSLSINDVISGIQNQYGQVPSSAMGAKSP